ncbi:hypothetical protein [Sporomusa malonica]|uniref:Uncharacterized protein n=1 Tax=Sporomusa malonica TaxID=112901 RepID=A0A1W2ATE6_9FIRM|nr:hypothetical protein [Sporomusa malonica]SMC64019.1 hypothetical protein SAMN04488500_106107 [Sporomusa malonica]
MEVQVNLPENVDAVELKRYVAAVYSYARQLFPHVSNELIQRNYNEFAYLYESHMTCAACMSIELCPELLDTGGYTSVGEFDPAGNLRIGMAACQRNRDGVKPKVWKKRFSVVSGEKAG